MQHELSLIFAGLFKLHFCISPSIRNTACKKKNIKITTNFTIKAFFYHVLNILIAWFDRNEYFFVYSLPSHNVNSLQ
jgi:hypothetical protein